MNTAYQWKPKTDPATLALMLHTNDLHDELKMVVSSVLPAPLLAPTRILEFEVIGSCHPLGAESTPSGIFRLDVDDGGPAEHSAIWDEIPPRAIPFADQLEFPVERAPTHAGVLILLRAVFEPNRMAVGNQSALRLAFSVHHLKRSQWPETADSFFLMFAVFHVEYTDYLAKYHAGGTEDLESFCRNP